MAKKKTPVAAFITDTHLSIDNIPVTASIYTQAFQICKQMGIGLICHGGDVFDSRVGLKLEVLKAFKGVLNKAVNYGFNIHAIAGNHDKTSQDARDSYLDVYDNKMTVFSDGGGVELTPDMVLWFLPYFKEDGSYLPRLQEIKDSLDPQKRNVLLTHIGVDTIESNDGLKIESTVKVEHFEPFYKVLIGHYHNAQKLKPNIYYIGSAFQHSFGETMQKGMTVLYADGTLELIPFSFPKYETVHIKYNEVNSERLIEQYGERIRRGDKIRLKIGGSKSEVLLSDHILQELKIGGFDVQRDYQQYVEKDYALLPIVARHDKTTLKDEYIRFCEKRGKDPDMGMYYLEKI